MTCRFIFDGAFAFLLCPPHFPMSMWMYFPRCLSFELQQNKICLAFKHFRQINRCSAILDSHTCRTTFIMPELPAKENIPPATTTTTDDKIKSPQQIDLEEAETALAAKDYKSARDLLHKLGSHLFRSLPLSICHCSSS